MLLPGALFVLFLVGCWVYCLTDALLTPASEYHGMPKTAWVCLIAVTFVAGAVAWLIAVRRSQFPTVPRPAKGGGRLTSNRPSSGRRMTRYRRAAGKRQASYRWTAADEALARHPAGRSRSAGQPGRPKGPDDDPEFLRELDELIKRNAASAADAGVGVQPGDEYLYHDDVEHETGETE